MPKPRVDDVEVPPAPLLHDFYYEMRDGVPVLTPGVTDEPSR
jgi:hypothetical protein